MLNDQSGRHLNKGRSQFNSSSRHSHPDHEDSVHFQELTFGVDDVELERYEVLANSPDDCHV